MARVARQAGIAPTAVRPATLRIDTGRVLRHIVWHSWDGPAASGSGTYIVSRGPRREATRTGARLTLSGKRICGRRPAYTRLIVRSRRPVEGRRTFRVAGFSACGAGAGAPDSPARPTSAGRRRNCFDHPSACGYPDEGSSGVPRGTTLTPVGRASLPSGASWNAATHELSINAPGTAISGLDVDGYVVVRASGVTIRKTRITLAGSAGFALAIASESGAHGTKLVNVDVGGVAGGVGITAAVNNRGSNDLTIVGSQLHDCAECFQNEARSGGTTTIRDSYMRSSDPAPQCAADCPHYEVAYTSGNPGPMLLEHNTMLNPVDQTAVVFVNEDRHDDLTIKDNLLAGGGYTIYGGANSRRQVITGNRFAAAFQRAGLDTHSGGRWPIPGVCTPRRSSGCFGNLASVPSRTQLTWSGNYWDDTLRPAAY
jgi:hypothetical protein